MKWKTRAIEILRDLWPTEFCRGVGTVGLFFLCYAFVMEGYDPVHQEAWTSVRDMAGGTGLAGFLFMPLLKGLIRKILPEEE